MISFLTLQDEAGNWLNQYNWKQDENGEWYYDDQASAGYEGWLQDENGEWYYAASSYEGYMQNENGEWVEDPNYTGATSATSTAEQSQKQSTSGASTTANHVNNKSKTTTTTNSETPETSKQLVNGDVKPQTIKKTDDEKDTIKGATAATVLVSETNGTTSKETSKLPPRPLDYDYYWYQDEDGNWRNEYDDYGLFHLQSIYFWMFFHLFISQCAGAGFKLQHFYHRGDPVFQVWNCHKNHPLCLFFSPTVTPPMLIFKKFESTK